MKLYFAPRTRAIRPRWLLEELEVPYEVVKEPPPPALAPLGEVPVLVDGDVVMTESPAICLYLADRFAEKRLAPAPSSPHRAAYLQWLLFAETRLEPLVVEHLLNAELPEEHRRDLSQTQRRLEGVLAAIDTRLAGRSFLVGDSFTTADLVMASILHLAHNLKLLAAHPALFEYALAHARRPAVRRAFT